MTTTVDEEPGFHWQYAAVSTGVAIVGTFVWAVAYGLVFRVLFGVRSIIPDGAARFSGFTLGLFALYAVLAGFLVGWRAPSRGGLYAAIVSVAYVAVLFRSAAVTLPFYAAPTALIGALAGALAWAIRLRLPPRTGE